MTDREAGYLEALAHVRAWHRAQLGQRLADPPRVREVHEQAIAWLDQVMAVRREKAAEDEAARRDEP